jgi:opacity protein-like surface antigen
MRRVAAAATALVALAAPAVAQAADYFNGNQARGAHVSTSGGYVRHLEIYCDGKDFFHRQLTFSTAGPITIGDHGKYSYKGIAYEYGPERQPFGQKKVEVSGKVTSKKVTSKYSLPGCKSTKGSVTAARD